MGTQSHLLQSDLAQRISGAKTYSDPAKLLVAGQRAKTHFLVKDRDLLTPAALTPAEGDHYLMPASGTIAGAWATAGLLNGEIAAYTNAAWLRITPAVGDVVAIDDENGLSVRWSGAAWLPASNAFIDGGTVAAAANVITVNASYRYRLTAADSIQGVLGLADGESCEVIAPATGSTTLVDGGAPGSGQPFELSGVNKTIQSTDEAIFTLERVGSAIRLSGGVGGGGALQDVVALDLYTVGDGVADDTAGFQAAMTAASGKKLISPPGRNYKITDTIDIPDGVIEIDLQGATITPVMSNKPMFQSSSIVFDSETVASISVDGLTVTTSIASGWAVGDTIAIQTVGNTTTQDRNPPNYRTIKTIAGTVITVDTPIKEVYAAGAGVITVYMVTFNGAVAIKNAVIECANYTVSAVQTMFCFDINNRYSMSYDDIEIRALNSGLDGGVSGIRSSPMTSAWCRFFRATRFRMVECNRYGSMTLFRCHKATFDDCYIDGDGFAMAISMSDYAIFTSNRIIGRFHLGATSNSVRGIKPIGCGYTLIANNHIENYDSGIKVEDCGKVIVSANHLESCNVGINCSNQNAVSYDVITITDNQVFNTIGTTAGIYCANIETYGVLIDGNVIDGAPQTAMRVYAKTATITDNIMRNYGRTQAATYYAMIIDEFAASTVDQKGFIGGNFAYTTTGYTAIRGYLIDVATGYILGQNFCDGERIYGTIPTIGAEVTIQLGLGVSMKLMRMNGLSTSLTNYTYVTAFDSAWIIAFATQAFNTTPVTHQSIALRDTSSRTALATIASGACDAWLISFGY